MQSYLFDQRGHHTTQRNGRGEKLLSLFVVLVLVCLSLVSFSARAERDVVRIGYFISDHYGYIGIEGDLRGYDIQISKAIGMYGGFKADMLGFDSVKEMEDALRSGEVDVLIDLLRTEQRMQEFGFTENFLLQEQVSLYTHTGPDAPVAHDVSDIRDFRIGYIAGSGFVDYFLDYCGAEENTPQLMEFHSDIEMHDALERGETDACITGSAVPAGYRVLLSTPPLSSYMMLRAADVELRDRIDSAITQLKTDDPNYISDQIHQYITSQDTEMSPLTAQEREFLAAHPELSVALVRGAEPFTVENEDGSLSGIIPDYYQKLGERLGVTFHFEVFDQTKEAIEAVTSGAIDILGHYYGDIIIADSEDLFNTMAYGSTECGRLIRNGNSAVKSAAVTNRTAYMLAEQLDPEIQLVAYPNIKAGYQAVMNNEVDAMIGSMIGISWLVNLHTMRGLNLSVLPGVTLGVRGAVSCDNPTLLFVLNKAISVSQNEMETAIIANASNGKMSLHTVLENLPVGYINGAVAVLIAMVVFLILSIILLVLNNRTRLKSMNREVNVDGLTGAGSRRYGTKLLNYKLTLYKEGIEDTMIVMFDVDFFKGKNDTYGHEYGDFVLKKVVEVLQNTLRKSDAIVRWGGDEFILMCSRIRVEDAEFLMQKIIAAINSADFTMDGKGEQITISAGAAFFAPEDKDTTPVLRRCDSALYKAKAKRNSYQIHW